eukprot:CAMPEP_0202826368 /NCGR_PEP_ID=MMETSP1389-20130828/13567_1 /ASSEMBLY_ACC=CAM_ASM_000865 /TAXON_ID=302021 /ORGANISM="Rhodomonas sp., Strain CCMP768" /LENGTH=97 /DNA_ID=CAMNT_0049499659 /DNA_START=40 /DNA_END=331 /DNA_ORIENTATION=+
MTGGACRNQLAAGKAAGLPQQRAAHEGMIESEGFGKDDMKVLMDDDNHTPPTRASIIDAIQWLVEGAKAGDSLFLHYSGQGSQVRDENGDERDGLDE